MFGYVRVSKGELKVKEYELYRGAYCGLCRSMGKCTGQCSRMALSYDFAFLVALRLALTDTPVEFRQRRCFAHPLTKRSIPTSKSHSYFSCCLVTKSCLTLGTPWTMSCKTPLVYGISQAEILEWVPFTSEKLPNPGIKPMSSASPELADGSFPPEPPIVND